MVKLSARPGATKNPEMRIWLVYPAALLTAIGLIIWGVSIDRNYHWIVGQVAFAFCKYPLWLILQYACFHADLRTVGAGIQMGNTAVCAYVVDAYPLQSMSVVVLYAVCLNLSAFVDPFFIAYWVEGVGYTWTFAGHAIITVFFCIPVFALLHMYGGAIRAKSGEPTWVNPEFDHDIVSALE